MENYRHIFLSGNALSEPYTPPKSGHGNYNIPQRNRASHSAALLTKFDVIWQTQEQQRQANHISATHGTYLSFKSQEGRDLITKSLENFKKKIRLLNVKEITNSSNNNITTQATVYIPRGQESYFVKKIRQYQTENNPTGNPKNADLVNSIEDVTLALLESLWTDKIQLIPDAVPKWCEVWLNVNTKNGTEQISLFKQTLYELNINCKDNSCIVFPERAVLLIHANRNQLMELMRRCNLLAEFRAAQESAGFWYNESAAEQQNWVNDLLQRINIIDSKVKVCVLDTGVNNGHPLLQIILDDNDTLTVDPSWGTNDHEHRSGHGTLMAGIAGYGELEKALSTRNDIELTHKLCSVKILPPSPDEQNPKELWGDITQQGVSRAEIQNPDNTLIYCMAITSTDDVNKGKPSSWSGAIDNLAFGDEQHTRRMVIVSAGNISHYCTLQELNNYPAINQISSIQNPAQSWNALTVGAYTEKTQVNDQRYTNYLPLASAGELSPHSTTSLNWDKIWPAKPDIVFEGGNLLKAPDNSITQHEDLELLSTSKAFNIRAFDTINATSAAAAGAAWLAAKIAYEYPNIWAETIRGLIVHSANWKDAMIKQIDARNNKAAYRNLLKVFGYGVPDLYKALYNPKSAFTFIAEETIQPFRLNNSQPVANQIHLFDLPWPEELLLSLENTPVKLKITLSYFIQPGAGEIGWKDKYRYQSHGLRFDINNSNETAVAFRQRINLAARDDENATHRLSGSDRWKIGVNNRNVGSIHSDFWEGTATELATCHHVAIYPVTGWWKERKYLEMVEHSTRYSLIISLETPKQDVELYTTVTNIIENPVRITINS
jgi:hypothetical protein